MASPRLWILSELYHPEPSATGYFMTGIAEGLAADHDVRVLCAQPTYHARGQIAPRVETRNGVTVRRCWSTRFDKDRLPGRVLNMMTVTVSLALAALRFVRREDLLLVVTNPPLLPLVASLVAAVRGATPVVVVHDVYPDALVATGFLRAQSGLRSLAEAVSTRVLSSFARVVVLGRDVRDLIARRLPGGTDRIRVIPNWGEAEEVRPLPREGNPVLARLGIEPGAFVVQYLGNIGRTHGVETLLEAARQVDGEAIHFLFVGQGARRGWLEIEVALAGLANCHLLAPCSEDELPTYLAACDVSVISLLPGMAGVSVPSRLYNVLASGRPVVAVAEEHSELARVVEEEEAGWVVPPAEPGLLAQRLRMLSRDEGEVRERGAAARKAAEGRYTRQHALEGYRRLLSELLEAS